MVEAYRRDATSKDQLISELKSTKKRLLAEVKDLKQELLAAQGEKQNAALEQSRLQKEVVRVQEQMSNLEAHLQAIQSERDQLESQIQVSVRSGTSAGAAVEMSAFWSWGKTVVWLSPLVSRCSLIGTSSRP